MAGFDGDAVGAFLGLMVTLCFLPRVDSVVVVTRWVLAPLTTLTRLTFFQPVLVFLCTISRHWPATSSGFTSTRIRDLLPTGFTLTCADRSRSSPSSPPVPAPSAGTGAGVGAASHGERARNRHDFCQSLLTDK